LFFIFLGEVHLKKILILAWLLIAAEGAFPQVCNTANTLRPGRFSIGVVPIFYVNPGNSVGLLLDGGIGLTRNTDLSLKLLLNNSATYFGGDFEFTILNGFPTISLATGMHVYHKLGIDGTFNITFPIRKIISFYGGIDADINFLDNGTEFPLWGFFGLQVMARRNLGILMEIDVGINNPADNKFNFGINVYF
jgi:hypothetical protein